MSIKFWPSYSVFNAPPGWSRAQSRNFFAWLAPKCYLADLIHGLRLSTCRFGVLFVGGQSSVIACGRASQRGVDLFDQLLVHLLGDRAITQ